MDATAIQVMNACNNFFAVLCEHVRVEHTAADTITTVAPNEFKGAYKAGQLLRIHGAYSASYSALGAGECYEVIGFDGDELTLDHAMHTDAPYLFIVLCEPTAEFLDLCADIRGYLEAQAGRDGLNGESIGGYSWSAASGGTGFLTVYSDRLAGYRMPAPTRIYYARDARAWNSWQ